MNSALESIIQAVLYEGYILYPYRASSKKSQRERFTFGRVYPKAYTDAQNGAEPCRTQAECLLEVTEDTAKVNITLGFVQPVERQIGRLKTASGAGPGPDGDGNMELVPFLEVAGERHQAWTECVERRVTENLALFPGQKIKPFEYPAQREQKPIIDEDGRPLGAVVRHWECLNGVLEVKIQRLGEKLFKVSAAAVNYSSVPRKELSENDAVLRRCFASAHFVFETAHARFVSLLEPPEEYADLAASCVNVGVWPVLAGDELLRERHTMLASPIILYDYPKIAPPSAGNFFDGSEIDEMLTLRVLTMTDEEKQEMSVDVFSRQILERAETVDAAGLMRLHGVMRPAETIDGPSLHDLFFNPPHPIQTVQVDGIELKAGDRVSIYPKKRADAMDWKLTGMVGVIEALEEDVDGHVHAALVLEDDPASDPGFARQSGHRFFYGVDEIRPLSTEARG